MKSNQSRWLMVSAGVVIALGAALAWEFVHRQETSGKGGGVASLFPQRRAATSSAAAAQPAGDPQHVAAVRELEAEVPASKHVAGEARQTELAAREPALVAVAPAQRPELAVRASEPVAEARRKEPTAEAPVSNSVADAYRALPAAAASQRPSCVDLVQGQIAWDYEGNKNWNFDNVQNLCRGTSNPAEPPRCFDRVMHGGINWGGGTRWQWQNALELCAGTNNADTTINCFQARIGQGVQWPTAIRDCK